MDNLPKLPHAVAHILLGDDSEDVFTADQMRAYALAAVEAEREACAKICDEKADYYANIDGASYADACAEEIRARGKK